MVKIAIIAGSTRPGRFNGQPVQWIADQAKRQDSAQFDVIDLADMNLPLLDEETPALAAQGTYKHEHSQKWGDLITGYDGFVFVTPEYNHSTSGALKNALDYLNVEWNYKPVGFVSYGSSAGGARAVEHLRAIVAELRMYAMRDQVIMANYWASLDDQGAYRFSDQQAADADAMLSDLVFWAAQMKRARSEKENK